MIPSWYDVLDVAPDASEAEIRDAWKLSIADLDPSDRRFRQRNRAAEVLLDPERRAAHDADLAADAEESDDDVDPAPVAAASARGRARPDLQKTPAREVPSRPETAGAAGAAGSAWWSRPWLAAVLGAVATALVVVTVLTVVRDGDDAGTASDSVTEQGGAGGSDDGTATGDDALRVDAARLAAEEAIVPVLAYDYRSLDEDEATAAGFMTPEYALTYRRNFDEVIAPNARATRTTVQVEVIASAIVRSTPDAVDVLLFVNRPTVVGDTPERVLRDQVTTRMVETDGRWLVSCLIVRPEGTCGGEDAPSASPSE